MGEFLDALDALLFFDIIALDVLRVWIDLIVFFIGWPFTDDVDLDELDFIGARTPE